MNMSRLQRTHLSNGKGQGGECEEDAAELTHRGSSQIILSNRPRNRFQSQSPGSKETQRSRCGQVQKYRCPAAG